MDTTFRLLGSCAIIMWIVAPCVTLILLYGVIRVGVSRGMRDHHLWVEKHGATVSRPPTSPESRYAEPGEH